MWCVFSCAYLPPASLLWSGVCLGLWPIFFLIGLFVSVLQSFRRCLYNLENGPRADVPAANTCSPAGACLFIPSAVVTFCGEGCPVCGGGWPHGTGSHRPPPTTLPLPGPPPPHWAGPQGSSPSPRARPRPSPAHQTWLLWLCGKLGAAGGHRALRKEEGMTQGTLWPWKNEARTRPDSPPQGSLVEHRDTA